MSTKFELFFVYCPIIVFVAAMLYNLFIAETETSVLKKFFRSTIIALILATPGPSTIICIIGLCLIGLAFFSIILGFS